MGVRITHIPTGLSAESRVHRKQHQNRNEAFAKLSRLLVARVRMALSEENLRDVDSSVIRTYHEPDNRVTDHRTGEKDTYENVVTKCRLDNLI